MALRKDKVATYSRATDEADNTDLNILEGGTHQGVTDLQNPSNAITMVDFECMMKELHDSRAELNRQIQESKIQESRNLMTQEYPP